MARRYRRRGCSREIQLEIREFMLKQRSRKRQERAMDALAEAIVGDCKKALRLYFGLKGGPKAARGLQGHTRTCVQYTCVPGRGSKRRGACPPNKVLRCEEYVPVAALPPEVGQRKGYAQFIVARPGQKRTARTRHQPSEIPGRAGLPAIERLLPGQLPRRKVRRG